MRKLFYFVILLKKKIENLFLTYIKKQSIRRAYRGQFYIHPFFIVLFIVFAAFVAIAIFISNNFSEEHDEDKFMGVADVNAKLMSDNIFSAEDPDSISADRFLEPFPIIEGMQNMKYIIIADKFHRVMYILKQGRKNWGVIKTYPIAIGSSDGRKQREGDKKTPEGLYFIVDKKYKRELINTYGNYADIYGDYAFVLNYPNRQDIADGRGGSGIWVHGTFDNTLPVESRGCLAMHNTYIRDLNNIIDGGLLTPIFIIDQAQPDFQKLINLGEVWKERAEVAQEFGIDETGVKVRTANVRQLPSPSMESVPITLNARQRQTTQSTRQLPESEQEIVRFVNDWAVGWGSKDIEIYKSFYDAQNFVGDGQSWNVWIVRKKGTFDLYESISVTLDRIKVISSSDTEALIEFVQLYKTERSSIVSIKQLKLVNTGDGWKIVSESVKR